jgi:hypothetical protein
VEKPKEVNLFDFDDEPISAPAAPATAAPATSAGDGKVLTCRIELTRR